MISSVDFVPLEEMDETDWRILDYFFLRYRAKNRIAQQVVEERDLVGFFRVEVFPVHRNKPYYYWPVTQQMEEETDTDDPEDWGFFVPQSDEEEESEAALELEGVISELRLLMTLEMTTLLVKLLAVIPDHHKDNVNAILNKVINNRSLSEYEYLYITVLIYLFFTIDEFRDYINSLTEEDFDSLTFNIRGI